MTCIWKWLTHMYPLKNYVSWDDCCCSVIESCLILCDPMDSSTSGFPVLHYLPELAQTHVYWVSDVIQPSHLLLSPSPPAFNPSQHWIFSSESALHIRWPKYWSFSFSISPSNEHPGLISLGWTGWISLQSKGISRVLSSTAVQKHQFFSTQLSYAPTLTSIYDYRKSHSFDYTDLYQQGDVSAF